MQLFSGRAYGILLVGLAAILWSTVGLYVRYLQLDIWTLLFWRSLFAAIALFGLVFFQEGRRGLHVIAGTVGGIGVLAAVMSGFSMASYVAAVSLTTIANVLTVFGVLPFVSAGIAYLWLNEIPRRRTLIAAGVALIGIVIMVGGATAGLNDMLGILSALAMTLSWALLVVLSQRYPDLKMAPINALGALLSAAACVPLIPWVAPPAPTLAMLALFGASTTALSFMLYLAGARYISASEAGLIGQVDLVLGPLWVWLAFSENPGLPAIIGGLVVLGSVVWYLSDARPGRDRLPEESRETLFP